MAEKRVSVRFEAKDVDVTIRALQAMGAEGEAALRKIQGAATGATTSTENFEKSLNALRGRVDANWRPTQQLAKDTALLDAALAKGAVTQTEYTQRLEQATLKYDANARAMQQLRAGMGTLGTALAAAGNQGFVNLGTAISAAGGAALAAQRNIVVFGNGLYDAATRTQILQAGAINFAQSLAAGMPPLTAFTQQAFQAGPALVGMQLNLRAVGAALVANAPLIAGGVVGLAALAAGYYTIKNGIDEVRVKEEEYQAILTRSAELYDAMRGKQDQRIDSVQAEARYLQTLIDKEVELAAARAAAAAALPGFDPGSGVVDVTGNVYGELLRNAETRATLNRAIAGGYDDGRSRGAFGPGMERLSSPGTPAPTPSAPRGLRGRATRDPVAEFMDEQRAQAAARLTPTEAGLRRNAEWIKGIREEQRQANAALADYISSQQDEVRYLGLSNEERAVARTLDEARALAMRDLTAEEETRLRTLAAERAALEEAARAQEEQARVAADYTRVIAQGFEDAVLQAKSLREIVAALVMDLGRIAVRQLVTKPFENAISGFVGGSSGGGLGGAFTNFISSGFTALTGSGANGGFGPGGNPNIAFGGPRAWGGPVNAGNLYLTGENGPELFVPRTPGTIMPANDTARALAGGGGSSVTVVQNISTPNADSFYRSQTQMVNRFKAVVR